MARGYDGTLRFDTKTDLTGLNRGAAAAGTALKGIGRALAGIGKVLAVGALAAVLVVVAAIAAAFGLVVRALSTVATYTKDAAGKVINYAKKVDELKQAFSDLKSAVGDAFRPLVLLALPWITKIVNALVGALNMIAQVIAALTGQEGYWKTVTSAAEASGDATKEAEGALAAFDKINVLKEEDTGGGGGGGGGGAGQVWTPISAEAQGYADKILETLGKIRQFFEDVKTKGWEEAFRNLFGIPDDEENGWTRLFGFFDKVTKFFEDVKNEGWGTAFRNLLGIPDDWKEKVNKFFTDLIRLLLVLMIGVAAFLFGGWILVIYAALALAFVALIAKIVENWDEVIAFFKGLWDGFVQFFVDLWADIAAGVKAGWKIVVDWIQQAWVDIKEFWNEAINWFKGLWDDIVAGVQAGWKIVVDWIKQAWEDIKEAWGKASEWFSTSVIEPVKTFFSDAWTNIKGFFTGAWDDIKAVWETVSTWFYDNVTEPVKTFFSDVWDDIKGFFTGAWDDIKLVWEGVAGWFKDNIINPIIGFLNGLIGAVESAINWVVGAANKLSFDIPAWLGGGTFGVNLTPVTLDRIPQLAAGAVIPPNAEFLAMLGDQRSGRNIEAPEDLIRQIVREETRRNNQNTGDIMANLTVNLDGETIWQNQQRISKIHGKRLVTGGMA